MNLTSLLWWRRSNIDPNAPPVNLAPAESFWMLVKLVCFLVLLLYNILFFGHHTHGFLLLITCIGAAFLEISGFCCVLWWNRTDGRHRAALVIAGLLMMAISMVHATLGYYDLQATEGGWIGRIAFPLIFCTLMTVSIVIPMFHWSRGFVEKQIADELALEKRLSQMKTDLLELKAETQFKDSQAVLLKTKIDQRTRHMEIVREMAARRQAEKEFVWSIQDPQIRAEVARMIDEQDQAKFEFKALAATGGPVINLPTVNGVNGSGEVWDGTEVERPN